MQVSVENTGGTGRRMTVEVPAEEIEAQVQGKLQQLAHTVRLDGFRPGKVPMSVVRKRYEKQVWQDVTDELTASTYQQALQQENLTPIGEPHIEQTRNQPGESLEYVATFDVYPEVEVPELGDVDIERPVAEIGEAEVDNMLEKLRKQRVTWTKVDRPAQEGDRVEIDFEGTIDGKPFSGNTARNVPVEIGSGGMIPGFEEQLIGVSAGDSRTIEVTFPDDYASKEVAGKTASFDVKVHAVAEPELPELDDEFARVFGVVEGGLAQLREEVRRNMERELEAAIKTKVKQQVFDALLDKADVEVPASLIDSEVEALIKKAEGDADAEADRGRYEEEARRRVALALLIAEIIQQNQLQVDPDRVREIIENIAQSYEKPEDVIQWYYSNQEMLSGIQTVVREETVVEWVVDQAKVTEVPMAFEELMQA
ncbi:MAG TPA: trigger factor [Gammaproteobacteria bacterium]|nr:trigger factor [Gammaproteobacteria bacterium]